MAEPGKNNRSNLELLLKVAFVPGYIPYSLCKVASSPQFSQKPLWIKAGVVLGVPITLYTTALYAKEISATAFTLAGKVSQFLHYWPPQ